MLGLFSLIGITHNWAFFSNFPIIFPYQPIEIYALKLHHHLPEAFDFVRGCNELLRVVLAHWIANQEAR